MSEQFEPTTDDFRQVWAAFNGYGGLVARPHSVSMDEGYAEFDRWLAKVKADAWLEGYQQGYCVEPRPDWANAHDNPYRQEADHA